MSIVQKAYLLVPFAILAASCGPPPEPNPPTSDTGKTPAPTSTAAAIACTDGKGECDGNQETACETDLRSSTNHCGACGVTCGAGESCASGSCKKNQLISTTGASACAISGGRVLCWGDNSEEMIAPAPRGPQPTPVAVAGIEQATSVVIGRRFGCAITAAGTLSCFRSGRSRELSLVTGVVDAAIQSSLVYIVRKNGELSGVDLGYENKDMDPQEVPALTDVVSVKAGSGHACVLHKGGEVTCWGDPELTGSGVNTEEMGWEERRELEKKPFKVAGLKDAVQISASSTHTCALRKNKQIVCWGSNWSGELGDGSSEAKVAPVTVQLLDDATSVAAGYRHTCARRTSGKVVCWGENRSGQLGAGAPGVRGMVEVAGLIDAVAVSAGDEFSCASLASGGLSCWGAASRGRLGNGTVSDYTTPQPVSGLKGVTALGLGDRLSCALGEGKQVSCWGMPGYSDENSEKRGFTPRLLTGLGEVETLAVRGGTVCTINKAKEVHCQPTWDLGKESKPLKLGTVKMVLTTGSVNTALLPSGQVFVWGRPDWNKQDDIQKANISGLADAVTIASDSSTVCGVRRSGKVACAGFHYRTFDKKDPVKPAAAVEVPGLTDAVSITNDGGEYCVVRKTGEVACFSSYRIPQPVDPKREAELAKERAKDPKKAAEKPKPQPIEVKPAKGVSDTLEMATGGGSRCALSKTGTLMCWGSNSYGQLGLGDYEHHWEPVAVPGVTDVAKVAIGGGQTCILKKGGDVHCWGRNISDEAGQSTPAFARSPVPVSLPKK